MAGESLLIVFSVLLALFLNEAWAQRAERAATEEQLASIRSELEANREIVTEWSDRHAAIVARVTELRASAEPEELIVDDRLNLGRVFGRSLVETMVRDTAWETAKISGLVRHFDLPCANLLTDIYGLQVAVREQIWKIAEMLGERETHQKEHLPQTLVLLELSLQELQGREWLLAEAYGEALTTLDGGRCGR